MIGSIFSKWWAKHQRRVKGLDIVKRVKFRLQINIPQFPEDKAWMESQHLEDWLDEFPQYRNTNED